MLGAIVHDLFVGDVLRARGEPPAPDVEGFGETVEEQPTTADGQAEVRGAPSGSAEHPTGLSSPLRARPAADPHTDVSDGAINAWVFGVVTVLVALWAWSGRQAVRRGNGAVATSHRPVHVSRGCAVPRRAARLALVVLVLWPWRR